MRLYLTFTIAVLLFNTWVYSQSLPAVRSPTKMRGYESYIQANKQRHIQELLNFVSIPSISSLPAHKEDVKHAAEWLKNKLEGIGMIKAEVIPTEGHPIVFAEWNKAPGRPTVLIYGHYDVQPVQDTAWLTPPFQPKEINGRIYGRGAADDKGGVMIPIWAVEAMLQKGGVLPVNVKFFLEGEEEIGSPNLAKFITSHKNLLQADYAYQVDDNQLSDTQPLMNISGRGIASMKFSLTTANRDLHSGVFGGKVPNAAASLAHIIASFHSPDGSVAVQGFYDGIVPITSDERELAAKAPYDAQKEMQELGVTAVVGEKGYTPLERNWYRPTLEITGMWGGYTAAEGSLNIVPGSAHCRISCRLVEGQQPDKVVALIKQHIESYKPQGATITYTRTGGYTGVKLSPNSEAFKAAFTVLTELYGKEPVLMGSGGSNNTISILKEQLGLSPYPFGFMQEDENFHSNNEFIRVSDLDKGQKAFCMLLQYIGNRRRK